jgi:hypothetical protein
MQQTGRANRTPSAGGGPSSSDAAVFCPEPDLLAEREGFEPSVPRKRDNGFRDRPVRPLRHLSDER